MSGFSSMIRTVASGPTRGWRSAGGDPLPPWAGCLSPNAASCLVSVARHYLREKRQPKASARASYWPW